METGTTWFSTTLKNGPQDPCSGEGFHLRQPEWIQGMRSYGWNSSSTALFYFRYAHGETSLWKVNLAKGEAEKLDISPIQWAVQLESLLLVMTWYFWVLRQRYPSRSAYIGMAN